MNTFGRSVVSAVALAVATLTLGGSPARAQAFGLGYSSPGLSFGLGTGGAYGGYGYGYAAGYPAFVPGGVVVAPAPVLIPRPWYGPRPMLRPRGYYYGGFRRYPYGYRR
jgi:hypothetical protein